MATKIQNGDNNVKRVGKCNLGLKNNEVMGESETNNKQQTTNKKQNRKMKTTYRNWLVLLSLMIGTSGAWAQTVPPGLIDNLRVVGIQKWEVLSTNIAYVKDYPAGAGIDVLAYALSECGSADTTPCYIIKMTVNIENIGDANVLFKDPQLDVSLVQPKVEGNPFEEKTTTERNGVTTETITHSHPALEERVVKLGKSRLVRDGTADWEPIAQIQCPEGAQKAKETQHQFEIIVGPRDLEHSQRLIDALNIMNNQDRKWSLWLRGTAKVGWRGKGKGESTAMVFSSAPVEVSLKSKPLLPDQIPFPK